MSALACSLSGTAGAAFSAAEESGDSALTLSGGLHYTQGNYGTDSTTKINSIVLAARYDRDRWTLRGTIPYLRVLGRSTVIPGVGRISGTPSLTESKATGWGDPVISASYAAYYDAATQIGIDVTGRLKVAMGSPEDQISTGEHDIGFQVDAFKSFQGVTVFAGIGYTIFGSTPISPLEDVFYYSLGGSLRLDEQNSVGLSYDEREPVIAGGPWQRELTIFRSRRFTDTWRAQAYFLIGFTEGSPDWGTGITLARPF